VTADVADDMTVDLPEDTPGKADYGWREGDRVVPAYALTQGRTRARGEDLPLEALVTVTRLGLLHESGLQTEWQAIVALSREPVSVAEIGAGLNVPVGVARVLVGDLAHAGYLNVSVPAVNANGRPDRELLRRLLDGLRTR
jgi:hypothetical protein